MKPFGWYVLGSIFICVVLAFIVKFPNDPDNFYHLGHADLYWKQGLFYRAFPWATYSVISDRNSDLWWGFHVLLSPLSLIRNLDLRLVIAPSVLLFLHLMISGSAFQLLKLPPYLGWVTAFGSISFITRVDNVRPQVLSSALVLLFFAALWERKLALAIIVALLTGWVHATLSYMLFPVAFAVAVCHKQKQYWKICLAIPLVGIIVACLRPGITDGLLLMKVQLIDLFMVRRQGIIPNFGQELKQADSGYLLRGFAIPFGMLVVSLLFAFRDSKRQEWKIFGAAMLMTGLSLALGLLLTRRAVDQFVPFSVLSAGIAIQRSGGFSALASLVLAIPPAVIGSQYLSNNWLTKSSPSDLALRPAALWLRQNTPKGSIVGHPQWSDFGPLFYYNKHNRYLGGMDPIFQYKKSPANYWRITVVAPTRMAGQTSPNNPSEVMDEEPISLVFPRDLNCWYFVVNHKIHSSLDDEFKKDPKAIIRFQDENSRVYEFVGRKGD